MTRRDPPHDDLFSRPHFRAPAQRHSDTSRDAAEAIEPKAETLRRAVLDYLRGRGLEGATDEEIQVVLGLNPSTARPRRIELCQASPPLVVDSGRTRRTKSKRQAVVWVATSEAEQANEQRQAHDAMGDWARPRGALPD